MDFKSCETKLELCQFILTFFANCHWQDSKLESGGMNRSAWSSHKNDDVFFLPKVLVKLAIWLWVKRLRVLSLERENWWSDIMLFGAIFFELCREENYPVIHNFPRKIAVNLKIAFANRWRTSFRGAIKDSFFIAKQKLLRNLLKSKPWVLTKFRL